MPGTLDLTVIVCTCNPRIPYLNRVMQALRAQDLPLHRWELLVVDNCSTPPVSDHLDLRWHPTARIVRETELGLTPARIRGINESSSELLVFVDDDNVLDCDYLTNALLVRRQHPQVGAFGGSMLPEFETAPPNWCRPYIQYLACSEVTRDYWSNFDWKWATPCGAGLCILRSIAVQYTRNVSNDPIRKSLDRRGTILSSGGDIDLALTATDLGFGIGRFKLLTLTHLIPAERLTVEYIVRLYSGIGQCYKFLDAVRPPHIAAPKNKYKDAARDVWHLLRGSRLERKLLISRRRAEKEAERVLRESVPNGKT